MRPLRRVQRAIAIRVIAGYRTISYGAATLLASIPPWPLEAKLRARVVRKIGELRRRGDDTREAITEVRREGGVLLVRQWDILLNSPGAWGRKTTAALSPHLYRWLNRKHGSVNFHVTQLLSGHGSFRHYLWCIGRRDTTRCNHCPCPDDILEHTLMECTAWDAQRLEMLRIMKSPHRLDLGGITVSILSDRANLAGFVAFASSVMRAKAEEERRRERLGSVTPAPLSDASA